MNKHKLTLTLIPALVASGMANAQEATVELEPISITASPFDKSYEQIAQPWYVLTEEEISKQLQPTLGETIGWQPGLSSTSYTTAASRPVIRGQGGGRVRTLANGLGTGDVSTNSPDHAITVDPLLLEQVEVLRGPATLLYGGSANGGAVNMVDGRLPKSLIDEAEGIFATGYIGGSSGKFATLQFDAPIGQYVFHFDGSFRDYGNYDTPEFYTPPHEDGDPAEGPFDYVDNTSVESEDIAVGFSYFGENFRIGFSYNRVESEYGVLTEHHEENGVEEIARPFIDVEQDRIVLDSEFTLGSELLETLSASYSYSDYYHGEWEEPTELGVAYDLVSHETRWELLHNELAGFVGVLGFQVNVEDMNLPTDESSFANSNITDIDTETKALFLVEEKALSNALSWEIGGRVEDTTHDVSGSNPTANNTDFEAVSGSTSLIYDVSENYKLSANVSYSERAPTREELYSNGVHHGTHSYDRGDDSLGLEESTGVDISIKKVAGSFTGELVFFSTDYSNYIFQEDLENEVDDTGAAIAPGAEGFHEHQYTGADATFQGFEASLAFPVFEGDGSALQLKGMFDYVDAENDSNGENLPRIPPMRIGAALEYSSGSFLGLLEIRHAFEQDDVAHEETITPSYTILNARADYQILRDDNSWSIYGEVRNLTDELAYNSSSFRKAQAPLPGRSFNVGLNYRF